MESNKMSRLLFRVLLLTAFVTSASFGRAPETSTLLPIDENGKCGYIDQTGSVVISPRFDQCWSFSEGLAGVELQHKLGFIDETGSLVVRPQFPWYPQYFKEGFAPISA